MSVRIGLVVTIAAIVAIDYITKTWATTLPDTGLTILPFLGLRLGFNTGVSFGLLAADGPEGYIVLIVLTLAISTFFLSRAWAATSALERAGYGTIVGGAFGNLVDRIPDGAVTDFLDLHVASWHFPTFNLADAAISIGAGFLLLAAFRRPLATRKA